MGLRLFKPRLFFVVNLAGTADRGTKVLHNAARLFDFDTIPSERPQEFLQAISRATWIA
jgi:hypothetical protein